jgi:hypothetical protein
MSNPQEEPVFYYPKDNEISIATWYTLKYNVIKAMKDFVFRRVYKVNRRDFIELRYYYDLNSYQSIDDDDLTKYRESEYEKNIEERYRNFSGIVFNRKVRDNDLYDGEPILFHSQNYSEFDIEKMEFANCVNFVPPRNGNGDGTLASDIICGTVDRTDKGLVYTKWFNCSEQFLRAWTAIMYEQHESFPEKDLRKWLYSGNRLTTNSYYKWLLSHYEMKEVEEFTLPDDFVQNLNDPNIAYSNLSRYYMATSDYKTLDDIDQHSSDIAAFSGLNQYSVSLLNKNLVKVKRSNLVLTKQIDCDEKMKRFYRLRTEHASRSWLHIYAALVLLVRYGEYPTDDNRPRILNCLWIKKNTGQEDQYTVDHWSLPPLFVEKFIEMHGNVLNIDDY